MVGYNSSAFTHLCSNTTHKSHNPSESLATLETYSCTSGHHSREVQLLLHRVWQHVRTYLHHLCLRAELFLGNQDRGEWNQKYLPASEPTSHHRNSEVVVQCDAFIYVWLFDHSALQLIYRICVYIIFESTTSTRASYYHTSSLCY